MGPLQKTCQMNDTDISVDVSLTEKKSQKDPWKLWSTEIKTKQKPQGRGLGKKSFDRHHSDFHFYS